MSNESAGSRRQSQSRDLVTATEFFGMLRRVVEFREQPKIGDPLQGAVDLIGANPAFAQSRLVMRILNALPTRQGEFRRAEAAALDAPTLALVLSLLDLDAAGTRSQQDWLHAIDAAQAASA